MPQHLQTPPQSSHKAWASALAGALTTLVGLGIAKITGITPPSESALMDAVHVIMSAVTMAIITGGVAFMVPNRPKDSPSSHIPQELGRGGSNTGGDVE